MGYRTYLGKVSKKDYDKYHNMTFEELKKSIGKKYEDGSVSIFWDCLDSFEKISEIIINNEREILSNHTEDFFINYKDSDTIFKATDNKLFLEALIQDNKNTILSWFDKINNEKNNDNFDNLIHNFNLNYLEISNEISKSKYLLMDVSNREYAHFNYIYLLKTFDFENEMLVYIGY